MKSTPIPLNSVVTHNSKFGMSKQAGLVVADAGVKYGRHYVWVSWVHPETQDIMKTAFWDHILRVSPQTAKDFIETTAKSMTCAENKS